MRNIIAITIIGLLSATGPKAQDQTTGAASPTPILSADVEICTAVVGHAPSGSGTSFSADVASLCCWSRISGAAGEVSVKHVWLFEGKTMAVVDLPVKGDPWRTHSEKKILPAWTGCWEVRVTDVAGNDLKAVAFTVGDPATKVQ